MKERGNEIGGYPLRNSIREKANSHVTGVVIRSIFKSTWRQVSVKVGRVRPVISEEQE